jgi:hypothetical protein
MAEEMRDRVEEILFPIQWMRRTTCQFQQDEVYLFCLDVIIYAFRIVDGPKSEI